jgi:hypothetical protein
LVKEAEILACNSEEEINSLYQEWIAEKQKNLENLLRDDDALMKISLNQQLRKLSKSGLSQEELENK